MVTFALFQEAPELNRLTDTPSDFQPLRKSVAVFDPGAHADLSRTCEVPSGKQGKQGCRT